MPRIIINFFEGKKSVAHCDLTVKRVDWNIDFNSYLNHLIYLIGGRVSSTNISIINETYNFQVVRPSNGDGVAATRLTDEHETEVEEPVQDQSGLVAALEDELSKAAEELKERIPYSPRDKVAT
jgi:hypothetical protein